MPSVDDQRAEQLAVLVVGGLGAITLLTHVLHLRTHSLPPVGFAFGVLLPMAGSASLVAVAMWLAGAELGEEAILVAIWCLVGSVVLVAVASVFVVFQLAVGGAVAEVPLVVVIQATVGGLLGALLGVYDAKRQTVERELREERGAADRLGRRLTVLNRVLRHDVRNAVSVIRGNAEMAEEGAGDLETVLVTIKERADAMARLSDQAREVENALSKRSVETERVDLSTTATVKALGLSQRHGYATVDRAVPDAVWVEASPLVEVAIENLLENAIEHNTAASPSVRVAVETAERNGRRVATTRIEDDGPGIPADQIAVLERGHETALEHTSGLGLWLVHWIVTASDGTVKYRERRPRGSIVELTLPRAEPPGAGE